MIDKNSVYCGLYTIVDEFKSHLSPSDFEVLRKENFVKSRSYNDIINKSCPYYGFSIATLKTIAQYIEPAAFGYMCVVKNANGIQKRYYSDNFKKLLQNAFGIMSEHNVVLEISKRLGVSKATIANILNASKIDLFETTSANYWAEFQNKLNIRIFICMRYGYQEVFGQGVQYSNPFARGNVVLRYSTSHDRAQSLDPFFVGEFADIEDHTTGDLNKTKKVESEIKTSANTVNAVDEKLLERMNQLTPEQFTQLQAFANSLYGFDVKRALLFEARRSNQIDAIRAFIKVML